MKDKVWLLMVCIFILGLTGCGKVAKESGSSTSSSTPETEDAVFFSSSSASPRVTMIHFRTSDEVTNSATEYVELSTSVTVNLSGYTIANTTGNIQSYTFGSYVLTPGAHVQLYSKVPAMFDGSGAFGWGKGTTPVWVKGAAKFELRNPGSVLLQTEQL